MDTQVKAMVAVGKLNGSDSKPFQKLIRMNCEKGRLDNSRQAVAGVLLYEGVKVGQIPRPVGMQTKELVSFAEEMINQIASDYNSIGGALTAKGYASVQELSTEMLNLWLNSFTPEIPTTVDLEKGLLEEELNARLALTAQALLDEISERVKNYDKDEVLRHVKNGAAEAVLEIEVGSLEALCMKAARQMLWAFQNPNEAAHRKAHGELP